MASVYRYGEEEVKSLAAKAGKAQAAREAVNQRFQKDMAVIGYQMELQKQQRAMAWEIEKMEIASRMDFQAKEQERIQKQQQFRSALGEIDKRRVSRGGTLPDEVADKATLNTAMQYQGFSPLADDILGLTDYQKASLALREKEIEARRDPMKELAAQQIAAMSAGKTTPEETAATETKVTPESRVDTTTFQASKEFVKLGEVAPKDLPIKDGKILVYSPSGQRGTILPSELPKFAAEGYLVKPDKPTLWERLTPLADYEEAIGLGGAIKRLKETSGYINK